MTSLRTETAETLLIEYVAGVIRDTYIAERVEYCLRRGGSEGLKIQVATIQRRLVALSRDGVEQANTLMELDDEGRRAIIKAALARDFGPAMPR